MIDWDSAPEGAEYYYESSGGFYKKSYDNYLLFFSEEIGWRKSLYTYEELGAKDCFIKRPQEADWIEWNGGDCPFDHNCMIEVQLSGGRKSKREAWTFDWAHFNGAIDNIIKYRVISQEASTPKEPVNKYSREIKPNVHIDVYDVLGAYTGHYDDRIKPIIDHAVKKLLAGGERGHKDLREDLEDVIKSVNRAVETIDTWGDK